MNIEIIKTSYVDNTLDSTKQFGLFLTSMLGAIKMMHWYVPDYNCHQIFGDLHKTLEKKFDKLQEEIIITSKNSQVNFPLINTNNLNVIDINLYQSKESIFDLYKEVTTQIKNCLCNLDFTNYLSSVNSGINNTKEDILSDINQTSYLLFLNK